MYSKETKYYSYESDETTRTNNIRNSYFENRSCLTNVLDFLDQEVVIMPSRYFSYVEGNVHIMEDGYIYVNMEDDEAISKLVCDSLSTVDCENGYHLSVSDDYITIVAQNMRYIFTNRDMEEGKIIGTIICAENFNEILKKFNDKNLKRISKAIVCPFITKSIEEEEKDCLDVEFFLSMDNYYPEVTFKYERFWLIMINFCMDSVQNLSLNISKLKSYKLNKLNKKVDNIILECCVINNV